MAIKEAIKTASKIGLLDSLNKYRLTLISSIKIPANRMKNALDINNSFTAVGLQCNIPLYTVNASSKDLALNNTHVNTIAINTNTL